jgi:hypothetical protein
MFGTEGGGGGMDMTGGYASAVTGIVGAANEKGPTTLESGLNSKTNPIFSNSFSVGTGSKATSSPSYSDGNTGASLKDIPTAAWIALACVVGGGGLIVALRMMKKKKRKP